jgi:hypothetical protein
MARNVREGDIVIFRGSRHKVKTVSSPISSRMLIGGSSKQKSSLLWLKPLSKNAEDIDGWVSESRVKKSKRRK